MRACTYEVHTCAYESSDCRLRTTRHSREEGESCVGNIGELCFMYGGEVPSTGRSHREKKQC